MCSSPTLHSSVLYCVCTTASLAGGGASGGAAGATTDFGGVEGDGPVDGNPTTASRASSFTTVIGAPTGGGYSTNPGSFTSVGSAGSSRSGVRVPLGPGATASPMQVQGGPQVTSPAGSMVSVGSSTSSVSLFSPSSACGGVAAGIVAPPTLRVPSQFSAMLGLYYPGDVPTVLGDGTPSSGGTKGGAASGEMVVPFANKMCAGACAGST
jgi:hypothetical protein